MQVESNLHVGFVVCADLLDPDVILGLNERLSGAVCLGESHDTGYVLELTVIVNLNLQNHTQIVPMSNVYSTSPPLTPQFN